VDLNLLVTTVPVLLALLASGVQADHAKAEFPVRELFDFRKA
jgi:hypothetical protein